MSNLFSGIMTVIVYVAVIIVLIVLAVLTLGKVSPKAANLLNKAKDKAKKFGEEVKQEAERLEAEKAEVINV